MLPRLGQRGFVGHVRDAEVAELDLAGRGQEDVRRFDVAVNDALLERSLEPTRQIADKSQGLELVERLLAIEVAVERAVLGNTRSR